MAIHSDISRKSDVEVALLTATTALGLANGLQTSNAGSLFIPDGAEPEEGESSTGIVVGSAADGVGDGVARQLEDGSLVPLVDLDPLEQANKDFQENLDAVKDDMAAAKEQMEQQKQEVAENTQELRDSVSEVQEGVEDTRSQVADMNAAVTVLNQTVVSNQTAAEKNHDALVESLDGVESRVGAAEIAASELSDAVDATKITVKKHGDELGSLGQQLSVTTDTAGSALSLATDTVQDVKGVKSTAESALSNAESALSQVSEVSQTASEISSRLSKDYSTSKDIAEAYSLKSEVSQTADELRASLSKSVSDAEEKYETQANAKLTADGILATVQSNAETAETTFATKTEVQVADDAITQLVAENVKTADGKYETQSHAEQTAKDIRAEVKSVSDTATSTFATKSEVTQKADSITQSVAATYATKSVVEALQNIADNAVETWTGSDVPSLSNKPASEWTTDVLKKQHSGDVYYGTGDGKSYRFGNPDGGGWAWTLIKDSDITKALQDAAKAQSTADKITDTVTKLDIPATFATKSEVKQTTDAITQSVNANLAAAEQTYATKSEVNQKADSITQSVSETVARQNAMISDPLEMIPNGAPIAPTPSVDSRGRLTYNETDKVWERVFPGKETHIDFLYTGKTPKYQSKAETYRLSVTVRLTDGEWAETDYIKMGVSNGWRDYAIKGLTTDWQTFTQDITVPASPWTIDYLAYMSSYAASEGAKTVQFRNISCRKVTDIVDLDKSVAATYASKSELKQTADSITQTVSKNVETAEGTYATKTELAQTDGKIASSIKTQADADKASYVHSNDMIKTADDITSRLTALDETDKATTTTVNELKSDAASLKNTISATYATKKDMDALDASASKTFDFLGANGHKYAWYKLGTLTQNTQGKMTKLEVILSAGNNGIPDQNKTATIYVQRGLGDGVAKDMFGISVLNHNWGDVKVLGLMSSKGSDLDLWVSMLNQSLYTTGNYVLSGFRQKWVDGRTYSETDPTGALTAQNVKYYESPEQAKQALANTVASTYTTKSEFTQTTDKIQSSVTASLNRMGGNMLINGGFETGDMTGWGPIDVKESNLVGAQHSGKNLLWFRYLDENISKIRSNNYLSFQNGHKYRLSFWVSMMDTVTFNTSIWSTAKRGVKAEVTPTGSSGGKYVQITNEFDWTLEDVHDGYVVLEFPFPTTADTQNGVRLDDFELTDITDYSELSSLVTQTSEQWGVQLNQVATASTDAISDVKTTISNQSDALGAVSDKVDDEISQRQAYMQFTQDEKGKPSLELGASENTNKVTLSNDRLSFMSENSEVAYISNKELHINNATIVQSLVIGNIGFLPRADGHLTLTRI